MRRRGHQPDYVVITLVFLIVVFGLVMLASASSGLAQKRTGDSYFYVKQQMLKGLLPGVIFFIIGLFIPYKKYQKIGALFMVASIGLPLLVFTPLGISANNAQRWVEVGPLSFQPSEILKLTFVLYLAAWLAASRSKRTHDLFEGFLPFLLVSGLIAGILVMQPATSTVAILVAAGLAIFFAAGGRSLYIIGAIVVGIAAIAALIFISGPDSYRAKRILTYINPTSDELGKGFHVNEALTTIGAGQITGMGYGEAITKRSLPAAMDDSIFAVIAGEFGFIGAGSLIAVFGFLVFRIFWLAYKTEDRFGQLILVGFGTIIFLQSFVNIGAISGLLPLTGVPLPFVSYGGTALVVFLGMTGIITNISRYT